METPWLLAEKHLRYKLAIVSKIYGILNGAFLFNSVYFIRQSGSSSVCFPMHHATFRLLLLQSHFKLFKIENKTWERHVDEQATECHPIGWDRL